MARVVGMVLQANHVMGPRSNLSWWGRENIIPIFFGGSLNLSQCTQELKLFSPLHHLSVLSVSPTARTSASNHGGWKVRLVERNSRNPSAN